MKKDLITVIVIWLVGAMGAAGGIRSCRVRAELYEEG